MLNCSAEEERLTMTESAAAGRRSSDGRKTFSGGEKWLS